MLISGYIFSNLSSFLAVKKLRFFVARLLSGLKKKDIEMRKISPVKIFNLRTFEIDLLV